MRRRYQTDTTPKHSAEKFPARLKGAVHVAAVQTARCAGPTAPADIRGAPPDAGSDDIPKSCEFESEGRDVVERNEAATMSSA
jgi:hypothetical protein